MPASTKTTPVAPKKQGYEPQELRFNSVATVDLQAAQGPELKRFSITAYNGGSLSLSNFDHPAYIEIDSVKIHGSTDQQPALKDHDTRKIVGHGRPVINAENLRVEDGVISHQNEFAHEIVSAAANGFEWQASVGGKMTQRPLKIQAGQTRSVNGRNVAGPAYVVRAFLWRETSFCGIGCDDERASAQVAASIVSNTMNFELWASEKGFSLEGLDEKNLATLKAMHEADEKAAEEAKAQAEKEAAEAAADQSDANAPAPTDAAAAPEVVAAAVIPRVDPQAVAAADLKAYRDQIRDGRRAEDKRLSDLEGLREQYLDAVPKLVMASLFDQAIGGDLEKNSFELELIKAARQPRQIQANFSNSPYKVQNFDAAVVEAALLRTGGMSEKEIAASVRSDYGSDRVEQVMNDSTNKEFQGYGLHDLVFASIESSGEQIPSRRMNADVISTAMRCSQLVQASGNSASTVSLPGVLSRIANKQMLSAYEDNMGVANVICSTTDTPDFKAFDSYRVTEAGVLEKVGPNGEVKHSSLGEETFSNRVHNHGRLIGITQEMFVNDDMGAFQQVSRLFGRMSAHAIEQTVIEQLTNASAGSAATDFFSDTANGNNQPNYLTGTELDIDSLGTAWTLMADQTDSDGKPVMIQPGVLLTTTANAILAKSLFNSTEVRITGDTNRTRTVDNPHAGQFTPAVSAYLGRAMYNPSVPAAPTRQWFLCSKATADFAPIQLAFLSGQRTPRIERFDFQADMLGMTFRAVLPFGTALQDRRCIVKAITT